MPTARKLLLSLGFFAVQPSLGAWRQLIMGVPFYAVFLAAKHFKKLPKVVRKHPQSFLHASMWALIGVFWLPVIWIQARMRDEARLSVEQGIALTARYNRLYRIWFACGVPAFSAILVLLWLMVVRPVIAF